MIVGDAGTEARAVVAPRVGRAVCSIGPIWESARRIRAHLVQRSDGIGTNLRRLLRFGALRCDDGKKGERQQQQAEANANGP
jgi:hypothetical protein